MGVVLMAVVSTARRFYEEQIRYLVDKDTDGLIDNHYTEDATLISHNGVVRGRQALKEYFRGYVQRLGNLDVKSTDKFTETQDTIMFEASVRSALGDARVYDAFVMRDGKIAYHFTGVMS
jgi:hypothetical protein